MATEILLDANGVSAINSMNAINSAAANSTSANSTSANSTSANSTSANSTSSANSDTAANEGAALTTATATVRPALWKDYLVLTKPRVISLLLFTTLTAMVIARQGWPGTGLVLATALGFYMAAGAAHTINMILDRDLDARMPRTANRPLVAGRISVRDAAIFAAVLSVGSFALLWTQASPMAAWMSLSGLLFYVVVYTMLLKRRTWSNIVIGGAAGSFPPLVGWAAVTGDLSALAWILFAIIFAWTPVHFWALAILIKDDYAEAGVPMLPVVAGEHKTAVQIAGYAIVTVAATLAPLAVGGAGGFYVVSAIILNGFLLAGSWKLLRQPTRPRASALFHYSMLYLALLFLALALDRVQWS